MKLPKFSLRDLFWLVLVCAISLGWGLNYLSNVTMRWRATELDRKCQILRGELKELTDLNNKITAAIRREGYYLARNKKGDQFLVREGTPSHPGGFVPD